MTTNLKYQLPVAGTVNRNLRDKVGESVSVKDFGAVGDGIHNDTSAILAALSSGAGIVLIPPGTYNVSSTLAIPAGVTLLGSGYEFTLLSLVADVVGVTLDSYSQLRGLKIHPAVTHTHNGVEIGGPSLDGGRAIVADIWVNGMGNDAMQVRHGNLGCIRDVILTSCGRDGLNFTNESSDTNAWRVEGMLDIRGHARDGVHLATGSSYSDPSTARCISGDMLVSQGNGRYGLYIGTRSNVITVYAESSGTADIYLDTNAYGNEVKVVLGGNITDLGTGNVIAHNSMDADYKRGFITKMLFSGKPTAGLRIDSDDSTPGFLDLIKSGIRHYQFLCDGSGADQTFELKNNQGFNFNLKVDGNIILVPQSSASPSNNGELAIAATNTSVTFRYQGSDGVTRSGTVTLA